MNCKRFLQNFTNCGLCLHACRHTLQLQHALKRLGPWRRVAEMLLSTLLFEEKTRNLKLLPLSIVNPYKLCLHALWLLFVVFAFDLRSEAGHVKLMEIFIVGGHAAYLIHFLVRCRFKSSCTVTARETGGVTFDQLVCWVFSIRGHIHRNGWVDSLTESAHTSHAHDCTTPQSFFLAPVHKLADNRKLLNSSL